MKCPVCRASYRKQGTGEGESEKTYLCRRCGADLTELIHLQDQATWHYNQAATLFWSRNYDAAHHHLNQAIALQPNQADFQALAGQLYALQGDFSQAVLAWKQARKLDPQQPIAVPCLDTLVQLSQERC